MEPEPPEDTGLPARRIRHGHHEDSGRRQQVRALPQRRKRVAQVFKHLKEDDQVEARRAERLQISDEHRNPVCRYGRARPCD